MDKIKLERLKILAFFLSIFAIMLISASCGGNEWIKKGKVTVGLWKACTGPKCLAIDSHAEVPDWLNVSRAFVVLACISTVAGLVLLLVLRPSASGIASMNATLFMVIGLSVYVDNVSTDFDHDSKYGWSVYCGLIGAICVFSSGVFVLLGTDGLVERSQKFIQYIVLGGCCTATLLFILTCASNHWSESYSYGYQVRLNSYEGIWKFCVNQNSTLDFITCFPESSPTSSLQFIRAFTIMSFLISTGGCVVSALTFKYSQVKQYIAPSLLLYAALNMIVALSYFTYKSEGFMNMKGTKFGWSYMIGWISSFIALITSFTGFIKFIFLQSRVDGENGDSNIKFERVV